MRKTEHMAAASTDHKHAATASSPGPTYSKGGRLGDGDTAAGARQQITLAAPGLLPWACCQIPGFFIFGMMIILGVTAFTIPKVFYALTAFLTVYVALWTTNMAVSMAFGAARLRTYSSQDWDAKLSELQQERGEASDVMHIVILPNYKEDEQMLKETLENIGSSGLSKEHINVVLAMESREGPEGERKAERLMASTSHLFLDICATYHPKELPGEIAGKSSNTQWAFKQALNRYAPQLAKCDPSRVFLTVGDADTLWHPQFFSALAYEALCTPSHKRCWTIWQPPILLLRNLFSVPGPTRVSAYGTLMFELSGLANQLLGTHFSYSAYSMTLALAMNPGVQGWDADVIAEDHHMFCKCYFASLWEAAQASEVKGADTPIAPKVRLCPVWLPAVSYLVETSDGWLASVHARFQQARRHSQGVAELSYVALQYMKLVSATGIFRIPFRTHIGILCIAWKMTTVHIINTVQAFSLIVAGIVALPELITWIVAGGPASAYQAVASASGLLGGEIGGVAPDALTFSSLEFGKKALFCAFGPVPPVAFLSAATIYIVVRDLLEGRYYMHCRGSSKAIGIRGCTFGGWWKRWTLAASIQQDMALLAEPTVMIFGLVPVVLAAFSLLRSGTKFEYIVAAKPT
eukprot:CAMPEP_0178438438 /NCGR_PEP_ID=MMETSP0689_2-20121128/35592_1 /TAXON_ID=160604 /ORGANISM="Amphidinium massartii, Strain CS-259" /LENGTH=634 /DNA_ID=CAMNT_0020060839 /DNA_START=270 /DNA_END=2174 /DNA_ORIENTATION=+